MILIENGVTFHKLTLLSILTVINSVNNVYGSYVKRKAIISSMAEV